MGRGCDSDPRGDHRTAGGAQDPAPSGENRPLSPWGSTHRRPTSNLSPCRLRGVTLPAPPMRPSSEGRIPPQAICFGSGEAPRSWISFAEQRGWRAIALIAVDSEPFPVQSPYYLLLSLSFCQTLTGGLLPAGLLRKVYASASSLQELVVAQPPPYPSLVYRRCHPFFLHISYTVTP
jgi:hypothetical protein